MKDRAAVEEVRRALADPRDVCARLGLDGRVRSQGGGGIFICCPWHEDRRPSCSVTVGPDGTLRVHCFGCDEGGDLFDLVAAAEDLDIEHAFPVVLERARVLAGLLPGVAPSPRPRRPVPPPAPVPPPMPAEEYDRIVSALLDRCPLDGQAADVCRYLAGRHLLDEARRARWGALPTGGRAADVLGELGDMFGTEALIAAGLVSPRDGRRLVFADNVVLIPYFGAGVQATIDTLQRRRLDGQEPKYVFPRGRPPSWPYGVEALEESGAEVSLMLVEGAPDVLDRRAKYRAAGADRIVLGIPGVNNWRAEWAQLARGRVVRVAVDTDPAGEGVVAAIVADLRGARASDVKRTRPSNGRKDWNS